MTGFFYIDFKAVPILRITFVLNHSAIKNQQRHRITICPVALNNFEPITRCRVFYFIYGSWSCDLDIQLLDHVINHIIFNQTCVILELAFCLPFVGKKKKKECDRISRKQVGVMATKNSSGSAPKLTGFTFGSPDKFLRLGG